jgi:hypothetical protein
MARKLSATEFLDRHLKDIDTILALFKNKEELQYSEIRRKLSLDRKSKLEKVNFSIEKTDSLTHETQLMRILKALCASKILEKIPRDKKVFYQISKPKQDIDEIRLKNKLTNDANFINETLGQKEALEKQIESLENRIYELNLEIGKHIRDNIELKEQLTRFQSRTSL